MKVTRLLLATNRVFSAINVVPPFSWIIRQAWCDVIHGFTQTLLQRCGICMRRDCCRRCCNHGKIRRNYGNLQVKATVAPPGFSEKKRLSAEPCVDPFPHSSTLQRRFMRKLMMILKWCFRFCNWYCGCYYNVTKNRCGALFLVIASVLWV